MAALMEEDFSVILSDKLQKINPDVDLDVFVPYLTGILETEDTDQEEMEESIQGFLAEISEDNLEEHCAAIINEWNKFKGNRDNQKSKSEKSKAIEEKIASIREQQNQTFDRTTVVSAEQKERKEAILKQYAQVADGEGSDSDEHEVEAAGDAAEDSLTRNMNSLMVLQREKEKRDKAKEAADQKRQKDREDREKQKEKAKERKEAEKKRTQKGERRR